MFKQYSTPTDREIQRVLERYRQDKTQGIGSEDEKRTIGGKRSIVDEIGTTRHYRFAKTGTNSICSTYPSRPANTFPIKLGEMTWEDDGTCGCKTRTFTEYSTPVEDRDRLAHDFRDNYHPANTIVKIFLCHGKWYIDSETVLFGRATLTSDLCGNDTMTVENFIELPYCYEYTPPPPNLKNPDKHRAPVGSFVYFIKKRCDLTECLGDTEWHVIDVQLRPYCPVVGIDSRESCLVAAGLQTAGEWCSTDEPVTACNIVDYIDCDTTLPSCDTDWTFAPLYACCGQGVTGGGQGGGGGGSPGDPPIQAPGIPGVPGVP